MRVVLFLLRDACKTLIGKQTLKLVRELMWPARVLDRNRKICIARLFLPLPPGLMWSLLRCLQLVNIR
jgi:hypothetical protein